MSIYDVIETAVTAAENMIKNGQEVNDAVAKASSGLNMETVKRVVENVNVNAFCKLLKSGEDRTKEFPVVDAKLVLEKLGNSIVDDLNINKTTVPDMSYYKEPEVKTSSCPRFGKSIPKYQMDMYKLARMNSCKRQAELYTDAINDCKDIVVENMFKIASNLNMNQSRADRLFGNVKLKYGAKFDMIVDSICKNARVKCGSYNNKIFDDTNVDVQLFDQVVNALEKHSALKKKVVMDKTAGYGSIDYTIDNMSYSPTKKMSVSDMLALKRYNEEQRDKQKAIEEEERKKPTKAQKVLGEIESELEAPVKSLLDRFSSFRAKAKTPVIRPAISNFLGSLKDVGQKRYEELKEEMEESGKISDKFENVLKQRDIISEMIHADPVISQQNPKIISGIYKQLTKIAPNVSLQKEIVRSILRMITSQSEPLLDPANAKEIVKLELALTGESDEAL